MRGPATRIRVIYDGEVFKEHHAADTLKAVIGKLIGEFGKEKVLQADQSSISPYKQRLVTTSSTDFRTHTPFGNVYISRDRDNEAKKRILEEIAETLEISMTAEVVPKD